MKRVIVFALAALMASVSFAALDIGERAPDFAIPAALDGKVYKFSLAEALKKGPVVLYFFPAAFSEGCSVEAHEFAEANAQFAALGASVIGVSGDDIDTLRHRARRLDRLPLHELESDEARRKNPWRAAKLAEKIARIQGHRKQRVDF